MKLNYLLCILVLSNTIIIISCFRYPNCDSSKEKNLGQIDYTNQFKQFNIETASQALAFNNDSETLAFNKENNSTKRPRRLNDYKVCESINIKPFTAYAYYEYDNLESVFLGDSMVLVLTPEIEKIGDQRGESLYINFGKEGAGNLKARVPISNIDTTIDYPPFGELFTFQKRMTIGDRVFQDIWFFKKEKVGVYYSKTLGVVALEANGDYFYKN